MPNPFDQELPAAYAGAFDVVQAAALEAAFRAAGGYELRPDSPERYALALAAIAAVRRFVPRKGSRDAGA